MATYDHSLNDYNLSKVKEEAELYVTIGHLVALANHGSGPSGLVDQLIAITALGDIKSKYPPVALAITRALKSLSNVGENDPRKDVCDACVRALEVPTLPR